MRVLLDTRPLQDGNSVRGVGEYTRQLLTNLRGLKTNEHFVVQATHELNQAIVSPASDFDLIHYPFFDLFFNTLPSKSELPFVVTVHDVIPLLYPKQYPAGVKGRLRFFKQKRSLKQASLVITDSQSSKQGIIEHLGIEHKKIKVIKLAADPDLLPVSDSIAKKVSLALNLPDKYVVYVGDINYNKNLPTLLLALTQVPVNIHLVVISHTFNNLAIPEGQRLKKIITENKLQDRVHVLNIPKADKNSFAAVLQKSICLVQPSLWEGFGLPVLEAMQIGAVVVSSTGGSLPEVTGEAAIQVEPTIIGLADGIIEAYQLRGQARQEQIVKGYQQAALFNWERTARLTYAAYKSVLPGSEK